MHTSSQLDCLAGAIPALWGSSSPKELALGEAGCCGHKLIVSYRHKCANLDADAPKWTVQAAPIWAQFGALGGCLCVRFLLRSLARLRPTFRPGMQLASCSMGAEKRRNCSGKLASWPSGTGSQRENDRRKIGREQ